MHGRWKKKSMMEWAGKPGGRLSDAMVERGTQEL
jgi:hypothetical protein